MLFWGAIWGAIGAAAAWGLPFVAYLGMLNPAINRMSHSSRYGDLGLLFLGLYGSLFWGVAAVVSPLFRGPTSGTVGLTALCGSLVINGWCLAALISANWKFIKRDGWLNG